MLPTTLTFEMTDDLASRAAREQWRVASRRLFAPGGLIVVALSTALFVAAIRAHAWGWAVAAGISPFLLLVVLLIWLAGFWWVPRSVRRRVARLPSREVTVRFDAAGVGFYTALERLDLAWSEVMAVDALPSCWVFRLRAGAQIPVPRSAMTPDLLADLRAILPPAASPGADL